MQIATGTPGGTAVPAQPGQSPTLALVLLTSLFFMWGLSYGLLDVLNKHFQETLHVSHAQSGLLQASYFGAYFLWAMPAARLMEKAGYKVGILLGLGMYALGALLFVPATASLSYPMFLAALFVIASGMGCLETAANPYVTILGDPARSERRLNLSQSFNGLGQFFGPLLGGAFFFNHQAGASLAMGNTAVRSVYIVIAAIVAAIALMFWKVRLPDIREQGDYNHKTARPLRSQRHFVAAVVTQFFYIAAQVGVGAFFINFVAATPAHYSSQRGAFLLSIAMLLFLLGRFVGTALMGRLPAGRLLGSYGAINVVLTLVAVYAKDTYIAIGALLGVFFFMSIMFPTIFALGVKDLGANTKRGASLLIMSIVGGAIIPYVMGALSDHSTVARAYLLPCACFMVVCWYGFAGSRQRHS